jgi:hypothetical protein
MKGVMLGGRCPWSYNNAWSYTYKGGDSALSLATGDSCLGGESS